MLSAFAASVTEPLVVVTDNQDSEVNNFLSYLEGEGVDAFTIVLTNENASECAQVSLRNTLRQANSFLFLSNESSKLMAFVENHATGQTLLQQLSQNDNVLAFVGHDAQLAGSRYCENNLDNELNAYYGELTFADGLGLMQATIIMPQTFSTETSDFYENNSAAIPYEMAQSQLRYGLYLNENSYAHFYQHEGTNYLTSQGDYSSILVKNIASTGAFSDQQVNSSGDIRQAVGFDEMAYNLVSGQDIAMGTVSSADEPSSEPELYPVTHLEAERTAGGVELSWEAETDNKREGFRIFRKTTGAGFSPLAEVSASATGYSDTSVDEGRSYTYYVVAFDSNETSCHDREVQVGGALGLDGNDARVYPNPVQSGWRIHIPGFQEKYVFLMDVTGRMVRRLSGEEGHYEIPEVKPGLYFIAGPNQNQKDLIKVIVE